MSRRLLASIAAALLLLLGTTSVAHAAPGDLTISLPAGDQGEDRTPLVEGTADPTYPVHVLVNGVEVAGGMPVVGGAWSYQLVDPLPQGEQVQITAQVRDDFDQVLNEQSVFYYVLPALPTVTITAPAAGATIGHYFSVEAQVEGDPAYAFELLLDGVAVDTLGDGGGGFLQATPEVDGLTSGAHAIQVRGTSDSGRIVLSNLVGVVADVTPPAKPTLVSPAPGSTLRTTTPVFHGTGTPGDTIRLQFAGSGEPVIDEVTVRADGTWSAPTRIYPVEPRNPFEWGAPYRTMHLELVATDPAGNAAFVELTLVLDVRPAVPDPADPPASRPGEEPAASAVPAPGAAAELANTGPSTAPGLATALLLIGLGLSLTGASRRLAKR